jgi:plastocyanin
LTAAVPSIVSVLAASEPSKVPFYVAGGVLVAWAVLLAVGGMTRPDFPGSPTAQRAVMALSAVLVAGTLAAAVGTSAKHHSDANAEASAGHGNGTREDDPSLGHTPEPPGQAPPQAGAGQGSGGATVKISADPSGQLRFQQASATARPGKVAIEFDNSSVIPHDVTIERAGKKLGGTKVVSKGKATASLALQPGSYTFYCSVDAHRQAGMQGTLSVQP